MAEVEVSEVAAAGVDIAVEVAVEGLEAGEGPRGHVGEEAGAEGIIKTRTTRKSEEILKEKASRTMDF